MKINLIKNKNNFIVFKCDYIQETLSSIQNEFNNEYRIIAKTCFCVLKFNFCNCFLKIVNNADADIYFNRPKKNLYYAMKDLKENKVKIIAIIIMDYNNSENTKAENNRKGAFQ